MSADSDFSEEFELLKHVDRDMTFNAVNLPVNRSLSRFTNMLPYDHSWGRTLLVVTITNSVCSESTVVYQSTRPSLPVIEIVESGRQLYVSWKWDVTSKQDS